MKKSLLFVFFLLWTPSEALSQTAQFSRGGEVLVPLESETTPGGIWGLSNREADHATVAMNSIGDVVVAYHTARGDFAGPDLKQVEIAFFEYDSVADNWTFLERKLVGSTIYSPLVTSFFQTRVKCERPDVIAVGDKFFVVWTRRYDKSTTGAEDEPAILECAWVEKIGGVVDVQGVPNNPGLGFNLDIHEVSGPNPVPFEIRECAGVPDAVVLNDSSGNPTVGVAYPAQTLFVPNGTASGQRKADMRFVTCSINASGITSTPPEVLRTDLPFNGTTSLNPGGSAGLYLPDLAASPDENAFWLTYEFQKACSPPPNCIPLGRVRLEYWKYIAGSGWEELAGRTFTSATPMTRRRPMVSSYPSGAAGDIKVSIAFSKGVTAVDADVVFQQWVYTPPAGPLNPNGLVHAPVPAGTSGFPNSTASDQRPIPMHGRDYPLFNRCYFSQNQQIGFFDLDSNSMQFLGTSAGASGRPAVSFVQAPIGANPLDNVVLSWEAVPTGGSSKQIWLRVD